MSGKKLDLGEGPLKLEIRASMDKSLDAAVRPAVLEHALRALIQVLHQQPHIATEQLDSISQQLARLWEQSREHRLRDVCSLRP